MAYAPYKWDAPLEDGVYLNLSAERYFRQETRGSSDWIRIYQQGYGWWWGSAYNPDYEPEDSKFRTYGSALHAIMLEGVRAYDDRFAVQPSPRDFADLLVSANDIQEALTKAGYSLSGTSKYKKADWNLEALEKLGRKPWDMILEDFQAVIGDREVVTSLEDRMIRFMRHVAVDSARDDNAAIRKLLIESEAHPALAEVSIIATVDGVRRRWRIDKMLPGVDMDLKSIGNWRGRPLRYEIGDLIARNCWDMQREDYYEGRTQAYRLINEGQLFGGTVEQRAYIREIVAENETWDWLWLCYQKPEASGRAPILMPVWDDSWTLADPQTGLKRPSDLRRYGRAKLDSAIAFYKGAVDRFGFDEPWAGIAPLHFTDDARPNAIVLPHWVQPHADATPEGYNQGE